MSHSCLESLNSLGCAAGSEEKGQTAHSSFKLKKNKEPNAKENPRSH